MNDDIVTHWIRGRCAFLIPWTKISPPQPPYHPQGGHIGMYAYGFWFWQRLSFRTIFGQFVFLLFPFEKNSRQNCRASWFAPVVLILALNLAAYFGSIWRRRKNRRENRRQNCRQIVAKLARDCVCVFWWFSRVYGLHSLLEAGGVVLFSWLLFAGFVAYCLNLLDWRLSGFMCLGYPCSPDSSWNAWICVFANCVRIFSKM